MSIYKKEIPTHPELYISQFTKNLEYPYLLFIHGGPGFNCGIIEYLIEHDNLFQPLDCNIILYDQRNCGRSKNISNNVLHNDNITDLENIIEYLTNNNKIKINGLIGHSYGAKVLYDYYNKSNSTIPGIFVSTANTILTPRLNNLILDLSYLKKSNPSQYNEALQEMDNLDFKKMWQISEKLTPLFNKNQDRLYLYWSNLDCFKRVQEIAKKINLPMDTETFVSVRKDLYSDESNFAVNIDSLKIPTLWINGFHDYIINGSEGMLSSNQKVITFYKSAHYPHLEENGRFSELINEFLTTL